MTYDGYELAEKIATKIAVVRSEHFELPRKIELHPDDEAMLRATFKPPHELMTQLFGIPVKISSRTPRGGRVLPPTPKEGDRNE